MAKKEKISSHFSQTSDETGQNWNQNGKEQGGGGDQGDSLVMRWQDPVAFEKSKEKRMHHKILAKMAEKVLWWLVGWVGNVDGMGYSVGMGRN